MGMFSGITVALREDNGGFELNMADVRMEFDESFRVLNSTAVGFDQWCAALDRLSQLNQEIEQHDGRADKALIMFLNQNNDLAEVLGVDLSLENWDEKAKGAEIQQGYSMAMESLWESIKAFFKKIFDGIASFFTWIGSFFSNTEKKLDQVINTPPPAQPKEDTATETAQKAIYPGAVNGVCCVKKDSLMNKLNAIAGFFKAKEAVMKAADAKSALAAMKGRPSDRNDIALAQSLGIELDKNNNPTGSKPMFTTNDFAMGDNRGKAFSAAGWTNPVSDAKNLKNCLSSVRDIGKALENGKKLCGQFANMEEKDFDKDAAGTDFKAAQGIGKWFLRASSVLGNYLKAIDCVATDLLNNAKAQHNEVKAANKAAADAQKKADEAKAAAQAVSGQSNP